MPQRLARAAIAILLVGMAVSVVTATPSAAADLARQSRIGAIFADQPPPRSARVEREAPSRDAALVVVEALYPIQPRLPGYYGSPARFRVPQLLRHLSGDDLQPPALCLRFRRVVLIESRYLP